MIRKASIEDIPAIRRMADVVFRRTYRDILSPEQMEYMMDMMYSERSLLLQMTGQGHTFYIEDGIGYVSFHFQEKVGDIPVYHLEKLYVLPEYQGQGYGRQLFDKVTECVRSSAGGPARIELNVNRNNRALSFYGHLGMTKARSGDFPIGNGFYMNDYIMTIDV